jgi:hypothetical protein
MEKSKLYRNLLLILCGMLVEEDNIMVIVVLVVLYV